MNRAWDVLEAFQAHKAPIPEEEPLPGDEPVPEEEAPPHPDPVLEVPSLEHGESAA